MANDLKETTEIESKRQERYHSKRGYLRVQKDFPEINAGTNLKDVKLPQLHQARPEWYFPKCDYHRNRWDITKKHKVDIQDIDIDKLDHPNSFVFVQDDRVVQGMYKKMSDLIELDLLFERMRKNKFKTIPNEPDDNFARSSRVLHLLEIGKQLNYVNGEVPGSVFQKFSGHLEHHTKSSSTHEKLTPTQFYVELITGLGYAEELRALINTEYHRTIPDSNYKPPSLFSALLTTPTLDLMEHGYNEQNLIDAAYQVNGNDAAQIEAHLERRPTSLYLVQEIFGLAQAIYLRKKLEGISFDESNIRHKIPDFAKIE